MSKPNIASILGRLQGGQCNSDDYFAIVELLNDRERLIEASLATPPAQQPGEVGLPDGAAYILRDQLSRKFAVMLSEKSCAELLTAALAPKEKGNG